MSLFSSTELHPRKSRRLRARDPIQVMTGPARLLESAKERRVRALVDARAAFAASIVRSARIRIELLSARDADGAMACPWGRIYSDGRCPATCRCGGSGQVSAGGLVAHYRALVVEFEGAAWKPGKMS